MLRCGAASLLSLSEHMCRLRSITWDHIHTHTQLDNTRKNGKRRTCNTTLLDDMVVPCALMCMHAARVSIVDQAMALRCSRGAVVGVCVVDSPHMCILCSCTWNNMQYTNSPYNTACAQVEALYPGCACQVCYLVGTCKVNPTNDWTHMFRHMRRRRVCQQLTKRTPHGRLVTGRGPDEHGTFEWLLSRRRPPLQYSIVS